MRRVLRSRERLRSRVCLGIRVIVKEGRRKCIYLTSVTFAAVNYAWLHECRCLLSCSIFTCHQKNDSPHVYYGLS